MVSYYAFLCVIAASLSGKYHPRFLAYFNNPSSSQTGGIVAAFSAGATFGAFGCSYIGDPIGRVWALRIGAAIAVVGCALQAGSVHIAMLIVGRLINGFGAGQLTAVFPIYASEVAPPKVRGAFGGFQMLMIEAAIFVATATGYAFGIYYDDDLQWRGPLAVQAIPLLLLIPVTFFLPETPRWLISKGKEDQAMKVLCRLHPSPDGNTFAHMEFEEIKSHILAEKASFKPSWKEIASKSSWRRRVLLVSALQFFAQATGVNCVQYYAASIYTQLGFDHSESLLINLLYGAFGLIFAIGWVLILDRFPRVKLLIFSTLFMALALLIQSILSAVYANKTDPNPNALRAQVSMFFIFQLGFIAVGMLSWLIPPEMCPMVIRAKVNSVSVSVNNIAGLVVSEISPVALGAIGFKFFYVYVACNIAGCLFYFLCLPETSNISLEDMDAQFGDQIDTQGNYIKDQGDQADVTHDENAQV
ncbi:hypothetical protein N7504_010648 [Penicillium tannophilum]|nr:hypothetical protein N7504_010648 [Penicillium tannophilum]